MVKGFKIKKKDKCTICKECSKKLSMEKKLKREASSNNNEVTSLGTGNYAPEICLVCKDDITRGGKADIDYPEQIATLLDKKFEDVGDRFGGVIPMIDSEYLEKEIAKGVTKNESIRTQYDPVIVELRPHEEDIFKKVVKFLDTLSHMSDIMYKTEDIENENDELALYEITVFKSS